MRFSFYLSILLVFGLVLQSSAQKEGLNWYFGKKAGLRFHSGHPVLDHNGELSTYEGCSSISSPSGKLLFYTDGEYVYNANHNVMNSNQPLLGSSSATQSGVIVPVPNDTTLYFIFTVNSLEYQHNGFNFSVVNISANGGLGSLTLVNQPILQSSTERITSVHHANAYGVWVLMHEWESSRFRSYLVTSNGIDLENPVISDVGSWHGPAGDTIWDGIGYMKLAPSGNRLAVAIMGKNRVEVFDFNDTTGVVSNPLQLPVEEGPYGVEFSTGGEFLYASERRGSNIYQWDMLAGEPQDIIDSRTVVGVLENPFGGAMQMAADGKIYIARRAKFHLSCIQYPARPGLACEFKEVGVNLGNMQSYEGLPTFIQSYFNNLWIINDETCINEEFEFFLNTYEYIDSIHWDFGDSYSGLSNFVSGDTVYHTYSQPGDYTVAATIYHLTTQSTAKKFVKVIPLPILNLGQDRVICQGDTTTFSVGPNFDTYLWNEDPSLNYSVFSTQKEGLVKLEVSNVCGSTTDEVYVYVQLPPEIELGDPIEIEFGQEKTIEAGSGFADILWFDDSSGNETVVSAPGYYGVEVWDEYGCKNSDSIEVVALPYKIFIPTAFSPNNDTHNDQLQLFTTYWLDIPASWEIYNRWGELVFSTDRLEDTWDGTYRGIICQVDAYVWILKIERPENPEFFPQPALQKGTVTLLR